MEIEAERDAVPPFEKMRHNECNARVNSLLTPKSSIELLSDLLERLRRESGEYFAKSQGLGTAALMVEQYIEGLKIQAKRIKENQEEPPNVTNQ